ncbi:ABC transporter permease [Chitinophaga lutea]
MLRNYLLVAWRNLIKHKLFAFINIFGLALSMTVCMIVIEQTANDLSYDRFHPQGDRTYRILTELRSPQGNGFLLASSPLPLESALKADSTLIADAVRLYPAFAGKVTAGEKETAINGAFTSPAFFNVFGFHLSRGNVVTALAHPNGVVLSAATAERLFGTADPLGRIISVGAMGNFEITGVLEPAVHRSHIDFDAYASEASVPALESAGLLEKRSENWGSYSNGYTYVVLQPEVRSGVLQASLDRLARSLYDDPSQGTIHFPLQALSHITPAWEETYNNIGGGATWGKLLAAVGIALLILISACFNYTNLSIARSLTRAREVGIRKVSGASRSQVFGQYIFEAMIISALSLGLAALMLHGLRSQHVFDWQGDNFPPGVSGWQLGVVLTGFVVFTALLAGGLPAWMLSAFTPAQVLKQLPSYRLFGRMNLRKGLIVFQLTLSLLITICLFTMYRQFAFMASSDPGFETEHTLTIELQGASRELLQQELTGIAGVESVTGLSGGLGRYGGGQLAVARQRSEAPQKLNYFHTDAAFVPMMGLQLVAGGNFLPSASGGQQLLLNENAARALGFTSPEAAAGSIVWLNDSTSAQVRGVVRNFHYENLGKQIAPLAFVASGEQLRLLYVRVHTNDREALMRQVTAAWKRVQPDAPLQASWLKETLYADNMHWGDISFLGYLAGMCIVIAAMGLLALVIYTNWLRKKEIGVRKVMGANVAGLVLLLSKGYLRLLVISACIALPVGYVISRLFLQNFALRVSFGLGGILLCFGLLLAISLLTILTQTWRAAQANPADTLKAE